MRTTLGNDKLTPEAAAAISSFHADVVNDIIKAVESNSIVVVGMALNPFCKKACQSLTEAKTEFKYIEIGGYLSKWKERLAIKLWSGWPTYPQVFVNGKLVGGADDLKKFIAAGNLKS